MLYSAAMSNSVVLVSFLAAAASSVKLELGPPGVLSMIMIITLKLELVYTVAASVDTRCIDSNLESGRYISRVGRARGFLSLSLPPTVRYLPGR